MPNIDDQRKLQTAFLQHQAGNVTAAANLYKDLITRDPQNYQAIHYLGVIEAGFGNIDQAKALIARSVSMQPKNVQFAENFATLLFQLSDYDLAVQVCNRALPLDEKNVTLRYVRAISLLKLKKFEESAREFDALLSIQPNHIAALNERSFAYAEIKKYDAALESIEKALALQPDYAEAYLNKGNIYGLMDRYDDAIATYDKALSINPSLPDCWLGRGNILRQLCRYDEALSSYDKALSLKPDLESVWLGRGNVFFDLKRYDEALTAYDKALSLKPDLESVWLGRGNVFFDLKRYDEALTAYDKALSLKPDLESVWLGRGNVFFDLKRYDEALAAYDKALALEPDLKEAEGIRFHTKMIICEWKTFEVERAHLVSSVKSGKVTGSPFGFLGISLSPEDQLRCAESWVAANFPASQRPIWQGELYKHDRVRIAYLSADFHQHATSALLAGMFENHDKTKFELSAISIGPDDQSEMRERLKASFDSFINAATLSDLEIALLIRKLEIDILVDLKGYTEGACTTVLAHGAAPIQVNYLGYPGTMGADYVHYIIADHTLIPESQQRFYKEKVVYLPNSYQANDDKRLISDRAFTRIECGLPEKGFVFCCFNNNFKINPKVFDSWMRVLKHVDKSVLWLLEDNASAAKNLKKEAVARGVNAERLVFAKRISLEDHLARHRLADLFLDTLPYNAHTTASDALWAGLPVLTQIGETFAGRVAASLLNVAGLSELITETSEAYEGAAIELANRSEKLMAMKDQLWRCRRTLPLFKTQLFTRHIEAAYTAMYNRYKARLPPDHIYLPQ